jgi:magnesium chelatase subunit H
MFIHVKSTIRRIFPDDIKGRSLVKVVYVVLESQYQSALSAAVHKINRSHDQVAIAIISRLDMMEI